MHPLTDLLQQSGLDVGIVGDASVKVKGITQDSRKVRAGDIFVAIKGTEIDGTHYIADAAGSGAVAIVAEAGTVATWPGNITYVEVPNARVALAKIAAALYPKQPRHCVAVTGTNGKTSVAEFYRQMWEHIGKRAASIGTLGLTFESDQFIDYPTGNTSPDPILVQRTLHALAEQGVDYVSIEASSHGLHQHRLDGVRFEAAAFTNLSHDHLDYHKDMDEYFDAKALLFTHIKLSSNQAWINANDHYSGKMLRAASHAGCEVKTYGESGEAISINMLEPNTSGLSVTFEIESEVYEVKLPLFGAFQAYNICAAMGLAMSGGASPKELVAVLPKLQGVRGRMEHVATAPCGAPIFVDYAHTPDALEHVLKSLRLHTENELHVVFGCGGDRDVTKRPEMGNIADTFADVVVVTDDNPRSEDPATIRRAIMAEATDAQEVEDRKAAITHAVRQLKTGDVLVVAGKGHETYQIIKDQTHHFDDAQIIREVVETL